MDNQEDIINQKMSELFQLKEVRDNKKLKELAREAGLIKSKMDEYLDRFITQDIEMIELKNKIRILAPLNINILIIGESGTGKELLANALHGARKWPFVAVNCSGIPDTLLESEFFGCKKGAFTGATEDRTGYLEHAQNGTLFLDEIGDLPLLLQTKLLRVIQERKYRRIGDTFERECNCRFISATNIIDIQSRKDRFRLDLFYRLAQVKLHTTPLRNRVSDAQIILEQSKLPKEVIEDWMTKNSSNCEGNFRELLNFIEEWKALNTTQTTN